MSCFQPSRSIALAFVLALGLLTAGSAQAIEVCGNGICNPNGFPSENESSCPQDCGGNTTQCIPDTCDDCDRPPVGADKDADNLPDRLEHDLAHRFFPHLELQHADVDRDESYMFEGYSIPYTARFTLGSNPACNEFLRCVEIRYGIAYFEDHGDVGGLGSHLGDSEMYAVVLRRTTSWIDAQYDWRNWQMIRDFTAAHWGTWAESSVAGAYGFCPVECSTMWTDPVACDATTGCRFGGSCTGVHGGCLGRDHAQCTATGGCTWNGGCAKSSSWTCYDTLPKPGPTTVFAAESKHALYHTDDECDGGSVANTDECPTNAFNMRDVRPGKLQNIGRVNNHDLFDTHIKHPDRCRLYDVWGNAKFGGAAAYKDHFTEPIDWLLN